MCGQHSTEMKNTETTYRDSDAYTYALIVGVRPADMIRLISLLVYTFGLPGQLPGQQRSLDVLGDQK